MEEKLIQLSLIRDKKCIRCELSKTCRTVCLMGNGSPSSPIFLVGEAPGENEDLTGSPFVGEAGKILNNILSEFGFQRKDIYVSNAVKCRPPGNRTPKIHDIRSCRQYLIEEIRVVNPKIVVCLGVVAMKSLFHLTTYTVAKNRGGIFFLKEKGISHIPVVSTYHPAAIKRDDKYLPPTLQDIEVAIKIAREGLKDPEPTRYLLGYAPVEDHCVVDLETTGLNPFIKDSRIICIGTSVRSREGYTSWINYEDTPRFRDMVADPKITKIGHNYKFDYKWLVTHGYIHKGPIFDTMVAAHLLNEERPAYGLKELLLTYSDMGRYDEKFERALKLVDGDILRVPPKILCMYNAQDVDGTYRLYEIFSKEMEEQNLLPLFELVMQGERVMAEAEIFGVNIDRKYRDRLKLKYKDVIENLHWDIVDSTDIEDFNPNSTKQLSEYLIGTLGLPILKFTKKKQISMDTDVLNRLLQYDKSGFIQGILNLRKLKLDFAKYLKEEICESDGKVHADFKINGAATGRYSCRNPNLMAITKESAIRRMFISSFPKGSIMQVDYDQGELRVLAQRSKDDTLIQAFKDGIDIHKLTASKLFKIPVDRVDDKQRFAAKTINFGIIYGIGAAKLGATIGMPEHKAAEFIREYKVNLPGVREYIHEMEADILSEGEVVSLFGRRRRITIADESNTMQVMSAKRKAVNAPIQGGLHDLNILSMVETYRQMKKRGYKSKIIMTIHDAVIFDVYPGEEDYLAKLIEDVFCNPDTSDFGFTFEIPLTVSISYGPNWKDLKDYVPKES